MIYEWHLFWFKKQLSSTCRNKKKTFPSSALPTDSFDVIIRLIKIQMWKRPRRFHLDIYSHFILLCIQKRQDDQIFLMARKENLWKRFPLAAGPQPFLGQKESIWTPRWLFLKTRFFSKSISLGSYSILLRKPSHTQLSF